MALYQNGYWDWISGDHVPWKGCLYVTSTAILPSHQGQGWGKFLKAWQVTYAQKNGYERIKITTRESNARMIRLNKSFGFTIVGYISPAYQEPDERGVDMELVF